VTITRADCGALASVVAVDGRSVNMTMASDGMAGHYARYSKDAEVAVAE
jgi:endonuclease YncB( thermonuclease family)